MDTVGNLIQWLQSHRAEMAWFAMGAVVGQYVRVDKLLRLLKRWVVFGLVVGVLVSGEVANAQDIIIDQGSNITTNPIGNLGGVDTYNRIQVQSFKSPCTCQLITYGTEIYSTSTQSGDINLRISLALSLSGNDTLTSTSVTVPNESNAQVRLDTNLNMIQGQTYYLFFESTRLVENGSYNVKLATNNPYPDGQQFRTTNNGSSWTSLPFNDLVFYLEFAYPTSTPVPTNTNTPLPTDTPVPTNTPLPTDTPVPTNTPLPTDTPVPTNTPLPTDIPVPTNTPLPTDIPVPTNTPLPTDTPVPTNTTPQPVTDTPIPTLPPTATATPIATEAPNIVDGYPVLGGGFWDYPVPNFWGFWSSEEVSYAIGGRAMLSGSSSNVLNFALFSSGFSLYYLLVPGGATVETCVDGACVNFDTNGANITGRVDIGNLEANTLKRVSVRSISGFAPLWIDGVYIYEDDPIMPPTALPTATMANWRVEQSFDYLGEELTGYTDLVVTAGDVMLISIMAFGLIVGVAILVVVQSR